MTPNDLLRAIRSCFSLSALDLAELYSVSEDTIKSYLKVRNPVSAKLIFEDSLMTSNIIESKSGKSSPFHVLSDILSKLSEENKLLTRPILNESVDISVAVSILCKATLLPPEEQKRYIEQRCKKELLRLDIDELENKLYTMGESVGMPNSQAETKYFTITLDNGYQKELELLLSFSFNENGQEYVIYRDPDEPCDEHGKVDILISHVYRDGENVTLRYVTDSEYKKILNLIKQLSIDTFEEYEVN